MPLHPVCNKCKKEMDDFGGILTSPPDESGRVEKLHFCKSCFREIEAMQQNDS